MGRATRCRVSAARGRGNLVLPGIRIRVPVMPALSGVHNVDLVCPRPHGLPDPTGHRPRMHTPPAGSRWAGPALLAVKPLSRSCQRTRHDEDNGHQARHNALQQPSPHRGRRPTRVRHLCGKATWDSNRWRGSVPCPSRLPVTARRLESCRGHAKHGNTHKLLVLNLLASVSTRHRVARRILRRLRGNRRISSSAGCGNAGADGGWAVGDGRVGGRWVPGRRHRSSPGRA